MFRFPFTNFHELNLDWILSVVKEAKEVFDNGREDIDYAVSTADEAKTIAQQAAEATIPDGAITTVKLANKAVTLDKMASGTVYRPNLLDNWYFVGGGSQINYDVFPINQRAQTVYNNINCIDRWKIPSTGALRVTVNSDSINILNTDSSNRYGFEQLIDSPKNIRGKIITATILLKNNLYYSGSVLIPAAVPTSNTNIFIVNCGGSSELRIENKADGTLKFVIMVGQSESLDVVAVKLELGSLQSLLNTANGVLQLLELPNFNEEYSECKRYFERLTGAFGFFGTGFAASTERAYVFIPVHEKVFNRNAAVTLNGTLYLAQPGHSGGSSLVSTVIESNNQSSSSLLYLTLASADLTLAYPVAVQFRDATSYLDVSVE